MGIKHKVIHTTGEKGFHSEWNDDHHIDGDVECDQNQHIEHVIENRTDWPAGPVEGQIIYRTDEDRLYVWDGAKWVSHTWFHSGAAQPVLTYDGETCIWEQTVFAEDMVEWYTGAYTGNRSIFLLIQEAQSFTVGTVGPAGNHNLTKISLYLGEYSSPPAPLIVELQSDAAGLPSGVVLSTGLIPVAGIPTQWRDTAMTPFLLVNGTKYHIVCYCATCHGTGHWHWYQNGGGNPYAGGNRSFSNDGGGTWAAQANDDLLFKVWGTPIAGTPVIRLVTNVNGANYGIILPAI